jgi:hypothetical protein
MLKNAVTFIGLMLSASLWAAQPTLFENEEVIDVTLSGPLTAMIEESKKGRKHPFRLRVGEEEMEIQARLRGKSRLRVCEFPPIRLVLDQSGQSASPFSGYDSLKLVTHCNPGESGEVNLLEEYAAYRIFALLSEASYRVRLLRINYQDTGNPGSPHSGERFGFVVEPGDRLAGRIDGEQLERSAIRLSELNKEQAALVFVYQYLIGNTDWSLVTGEGDSDCCHNGDLFMAQDEIFVVPYDFDLAGIVNARYAKPDPTLRLRSVRSRRYRGYCIDASHVADAVRKINSLEQRIYEVVQNAPGLSADDRKDMEEYLRQYFKKSAKEEKLVRSFDKSCL